MAGYSEVLQILPIWHVASPNESLEQPIQGEIWQRTTIESLPEDALLEIFDFYRVDAMEQSQGLPWKWHRLAHVSRKWRQVVFRSPRRLALQILCEYGAPIESILASWPTLPLVAKFIVDYESKPIMQVSHLPARRRPHKPILGVRPVVESDSKSENTPTDSKNPPIDSKNTPTDLRRRPHKPILRVRPVVESDSESENTPTDSNNMATRIVLPQSCLPSVPCRPDRKCNNVGPKSKDIPGNVMVALRHPDRLCEIDLHVTSSMLAPIIEVTQKLCQALESIRVTVKAQTGPSILVGNAFLGGSAPHLRVIELDGIAFPFPSIQQVLLSTKNLVELHLGHIPNDAYFSPNELVTGLSTMPQLKWLTVDFHSLPSSPLPSITCPPQCTTLPSLVSLDFHGASGYLEAFVAQIKLPALSKIAIRLFNDIFFEIPEFSKFIHCLDMLKSPTQVTIKHNVDGVGLHFEDQKLFTNTCFFKFETLCRQLDWQLSFVTQVSSQLSFLLSSVRTLRIESDGEFPAGEEDLDPMEWLELFRQFTHIVHIYVSAELAPKITEALIAEDMTAEVLPRLHSFDLDDYHNSPSVVKAAEQFIATRKLSSHTVFLVDLGQVLHKADTDAHEISEPSLATAYSPQDPPLQRPRHSSMPPSIV